MTAVYAELVPQRIIPLDPRGEPAPVPGPGPERAGASAPRLTIAPTPRRLARGLMWLGVAFTAFALFTLVALNVVIAQSQFQLADVESEIAREQVRYENLRLEVAQLVAPGNVVGAARELGLVTPDVVGYINVSRSPEAEPGSTTEATLADTWSEGKSVLARGG